MNYGFTTDYVLPVRIIAMQGQIDNADSLLRAKPLQIGLDESDVCSVVGKGYIILDFGREYQGGARVLTHAIAENKPINVRLRFGESVSETCAELGERGASNDHSLRDIQTQLVYYSDMSFGCTGFRFLRIDFYDDNITVRLKNIYCAYVHRQFPAPAPFANANGRIMDIYEVAKHTIELCCQGYLWDGIKRDRLVWIGDTHPEMLALTALYGRCGIIEDSLDFTVDQVPLGRWMNWISMYSVWWLIIMADYCALTGAEEYVRRHADYVKGLISQISACVKEDGELAFPDYFVDWPTRNQVDEPAGCRALLIFMTNKAKGLCRVLGIDTAELDNLRERLYKKPIDVVSAKQVVALKYFALGSITDADISLITEGGARGMSTFMSYYILKTVAETVSVKTAVDMMLSYYGAMLDKGATSFFEDFDMDWVEGSNELDRLPAEGEKDIHGDFGKFCYVGFRHSLCHGWSAGVIKFLYEYCNEA